MGMGYPADDNGRLTEAQVTSAQALERRAIRSDDVRIDRFGRSYEPGIVFAHTSRDTTLQQRAPTCLCEMQPLNHKPLQRRNGSHLIGRAFQEFLDIHDGDDKPTSAQRREESSRRSYFTARGLALEGNEK